VTHEEHAPKASRRAAAAVFIAYNLLLASTPFADAYPAFAVIGIWTEMGAVLPLLHPDGAAAREAAALWLEQRSGDSLGTSLPSTHAAGSMTLALAAWRWLPRPVAGLLLAGLLHTVTVIS
jgi:membrane-associated phospholipid phosphatase